VDEYPEKREAFASWECHHPGMEDGDGKVWPIHPCSPKEDPTADPVHVHWDYGHIWRGCGWYFRGEKLWTPKEIAVYLGVRGAVDG